MSDMFEHEVLANMPNYYVFAPIVGGHVVEMEQEEAQSLNDLSPVRRG